MSHCAICGQGQANFLFRTQCLIADEQFSIGECGSCGVQMVLDPPADINKYYINTHMRQARNPIYAFFKEILIRKELRRIMRCYQHNSIFLDVGCGVGEFSKVLHERHLPVYAIDSAQERPVGIADTSVPYHMIDYGSGKIAAMPKVENALVILRHVLEHVSVPQQFLKSLEMQGVSAFYVLVPNHDCAEGRWLKQYYCFCDPPRHLWHFNLRALTQLFTRCGYSIKGSGFDTIPSLVPSLYRRANLMAWPKPICNALDPQGVLSTLSLPVNYLFPNNVIWMVASKDH